MIIGYSGFGGDGIKIISKSNKNKISNKFAILLLI